LGEKYGS